MTWQEIAGQLGIPVKRAMNVETRALRKLRKLLLKKNADES
jgi:DNA-directed RNA polymerase specialized sigma24 family protein